MPEHAGLHHVALVGAGDLIAAPARQVEGDAADALDLESVVDLRVDAALLAVAEVDDLLGLAEIDAAGQLAHDQDVEAFDDLALQRRGVGERGIADGRAQVGVEAEVFAQPQQAGFGARVIGHGVPFGAADGGQHHRVGGLRQRHVGVADGLAMGVIGAAADQGFFRLEAGDAGAAMPGDDLFQLRHDLGPDAVAGKQEEFVGRHRVGPPGSGNRRLLEDFAGRGKGGARVRKLAITSKSV